MATLYKNRGIWYITTSIGSKRITRSLRTKDKRIAWKLKPAVELELLSQLSGVKQRAKDVPFDELIERLKSYACFTPLANVSGAPAISLPVGISAAGLPIGAHFFGNHGDEKTLLELAFEIEEAQPWPAIPEKIPANVAA